MTHTETEKVRLTASYCNGAKYRHPAGSNRRDIRWDGTLPGFGLRLYPSGNKAYVIGYRAPDNRWKMKTVSAYGVQSIADARNAAKLELAEVVKGNDPLEQQRQRAAGDTLKAFAETYMQRHAEKHKKSAADDRLMIDKIIVPALGTRQMKTIKRPDISKLHHNVGETINPKTGKPKIYQANRMLALFSKMFNLAEEWGAVPEGHPNPCRGIKRFKEQSRDRWATPDEMPAIAQAIDQEPNPVIRAAIWCFLLTGVRKNELLTLRWEDVDLQRQDLRLTDTKQGKTHYVPLSTAAIEILRSVPRVEGNPFVFIGRREGHHLVNIDKSWRRVRTAAGVTDLTLHDLRRTVGSWLAQSGNSLALIGKILGHTNQSTTAVYSRFHRDTERQALETHSEQIMGAAGKGKRAEVVTIGK